MKHNAYILSSRLSAETTIARVGELFAKAGVQYRTKGLAIFSINTPIALLTFDRTLYSNRNWVGLNPFTFISGIDVRCRLDKSGVTEIVVQVNKFRTFLWVAVWVSSSGLAASAMPITQGALLFIAVSLAAWFGFMSFLSGHLIKKEISDCVNA